jgi:dihydroxyacetone kinase-like protein
MLIGEGIIHSAAKAVAMKKFVNDINDVDAEMAEGFAKAFPDIIQSLGDGVFVRTHKKDAGKVALVSGGGSGHEPAHAGYVGEGMLDAAVSGPVFTSPSADAVYKAIGAVATDAGVLLVIKNYTGDVLNFEMAADMASDDDIDVEYVVVDDDVAVEDSSFTAGRRGVAGTVFVHKIAGAKAEQGATLAEVKAVAEKVIANVRTMGVALAPCTVPAAGKPGFELADDEMEMGIGIHGEPGVRREKIRPADEIVDELLDHILADLDYVGHDVAVLVNGSGGTPLMELAIANRRVAQVLADKGINVVRTYMGNYLTSIEMQGLSISLLRLDDEMKELLAAPANTFTWKE